MNPTASTPRLKRPVTLALLLAMSLLNGCSTNSSEKVLRLYQQPEALYLAANQTIPTKYGTWTPPNDETWYSRLNREKADQQILDLKTEVLQLRQQLQAKQNP